jgi:hypothetical protein
VTNSFATKSAEAYLGTFCNQCQEHGISQHCQVADCEAESLFEKVFSLLVPGPVASNQKIAEASTAVEKSAIVTYGLIQDRTFRSGPFICRASAPCVEAGSVAALERW